MHFNKMKHYIRAQLSVAKMTSSSDSSSQPASQPLILEDCDIATGNSHVPENNNGLLES